MFYAMKLAVVDDQLEPGQFHLLRLCPDAWLSEKQQTIFENIATESGPVTLKFKVADGGKTLDIEWKPRFRVKPQGVQLHVPEIEGLEADVINGERHAVKPGDVLKL
jgi:hypothetical protein